MPDGFNEGDVFIDTKSKRTRTLRIEYFGTDNGVLGAYMLCFETRRHVSVDLKALRSDRYRRVNAPPSVDMSERVETVDLHISNDGVIHVSSENCEGYCKPWGIGFPYRAGGEDAG